MRPALLLLCLLSAGCTSISVDFEKHTAHVFRFATDAAVESATYEALPDGTKKVTIGGYNSVPKVAEVTALIEAAAKVGRP